MFILQSVNITPFEQCVRASSYFALCVGCADIPEGVTGGSDTTWGELSERCVVSSMCHTMHSGYPWRLFHFEEKVKCCEESVCSPRLFHVLCVQRACTLCTA